MRSPLPDLLSFQSFALLLTALSCARLTAAFASMPSSFTMHRPSTTPRSTIPSRKTWTLASGMGIARNYTWKEEAFDIEVSVNVPRDTRASDLAFTATPRSIDLRLQRPQDGVDMVLLDGSRKLRGRVNLDGTYWVITDPDDRNSEFREVTITVEKLIRTPTDDFEVVDYDWKGVFLNDTAEVSERKYDLPEVLNVKEYAASLGVDIDNINMTLVDKSMWHPFERV
jgi:hypothetical protein